MSLANGDWTTPALAAAWAGSSMAPTNPQLVSQVSAQSRALKAKLNRASILPGTFTRVFDGTGTYQLMIPDYPLISVSSVVIGARAIPEAPLGQSPGWGYRVPLWGGTLPGEPMCMEFHNGYWPYGVQNIRMTFTAGYMISNEQGTVPNDGKFQVTVQQPLGICCKDMGVAYASGAPLVPVAETPGTGQYVPPPDATPGLYTFSAGDVGQTLSFSYGFVPADLTDACNQMVWERISYTTRIGQVSKSLGGQETMRFSRGGNGDGNSMLVGLPPEVASILGPYMSVLPPLNGAPV